jgi:hypothetical protein
MLIYSTCYWNKYALSSFSDVDCYVIIRKLRDSVFWMYRTLKQLVTKLYKSVTQRLVLSVTVFTTPLGNVFQQWTFLCSRAHVLGGWRPSHTNLLLFHLPSEDSPIESESESELLYDWRFTANQFVLAPSPLRLTTRDFFFQLNLYLCNILSVKVKVKVRVTFRLAVYHQSVYLGAKPLETDKKTFFNWILVVIVLM